MERDPAVEALEALVVEDAAGAEPLAELAAAPEAELDGLLEPLLEPAVLDGEEEEPPLPLTAALLRQLTLTVLTLTGGFRFCRPNEKHAATAPSVTLQY